MIINLNDISKVKEFVKISNKVAGSVILKSGKYIVDGKSILGIFSLDLTQNIELETSEENYELFKQFIAI